jgi:hypothetical protein
LFKVDLKNDGERKRAVLFILASRPEKSTGGVVFTGFASARKGATKKRRRLPKKAADVQSLKR